MKRKNSMARIGRYLSLVALSATWGSVQALTLDQINFAVLPGNQVQVELDLSGPVDEPLSFAIDNPARVALDFPGVSLNLPRKTENIGVGLARSVTAVEAAGRTRVVLNLVRLAPYQMKVQGDKVILLVNPASGTQAAAPAPSTAVPSNPVPGAAVPEPAPAAQTTAAPPVKVPPQINKIDFRRGENGEGRVIVKLSDPSIVVDTFEEGSDIIVEFKATQLPAELERRLDVVDFATPVNVVDTFKTGSKVRMEIKASGIFDHLAYQSDDTFTVDVKRLTEAEREAQQKEKFRYTGERLSLNFQNIEVRAVLQLIADFTGLNLVASDTVSGNLTLRLKNVPWDQALDIILKSKGLAMRRDGNVVLVAPTEEIAAREKLELEAQRQIQELSPLRSEFLQVNYAKASELSTLLKAEGNSLLSNRGNVSVDDRTNTLLVRDTADAINNVRRLLSKLDIPIRQVLIESRIVIANDSFNRSIGARFGLSSRSVVNQSSTKVTEFGLGGGLTGDVDFGDVVTFNDGTNENLLADLPIGDPAGALRLAVVSIPDFLLQLELQALQVEGRGEVIANPRIVTANQKEAVIETGSEVPFQEASSSGATSTAFKKAVLSLNVTPQITPDDRVILDLRVSQDTVGDTTFNGVPTIDTRRIETQILVDNGNTVVLGGIFEQTKTETTSKVPFFGDLPYINFLFRNSIVIDDKSELLIFITPKILKDNSAGLL